MAEPLEVRLRKASEAVRELERELDKHNSDNAVRDAIGALTPTRMLEGQRLQNRLYEARQRQTSLLLESANESSNHLELATRNLQQTSEAQVKISQAKVRVAESQARALDDLLKSSHRLEQFAVYLLVLNAVSIFIVEYTAGLFNSPTGTVSWVVLLIAITAMMIVAFKWPSWIQKRRKE